MLLIMWRPARLELIKSQFKRGQAGKRHLNTLFSASRINRLGKAKYTTKVQNTMLKKLLPYA
jgi:large subunit ribosomal protein L35